MNKAHRDVLRMIGRNSEIVRFGPFRFVPGDGLWRHGQPVALPPRALAVLTALLATPGTVVSKQNLMNAAWPGTFVTESSLLEAIGLLRDALGDDRRRPAYIQTVNRRGYRSIADISATTPEPRNLGSLEPPVPFFSGPEWRPIVVACVTYAVTTICVAIVFAIFGQERVDRSGQRVSAPRFAISHSGELVYLADSRQAIAPAWTPSGLEIAFAISKAGPFNLQAAWHEFPTSWSPDGTELAFTEYQPLTGADIWVLDRRTRTRRPLVRTVFDESWARFSPDGRWVAYMSNASGRWDVYLQSSSGSGARVRVSSSGGAWPSWSNDGGTVYFTAGGNTMASAIRTDSGLAAAVATIVRPGGSRGHARADLRIVLDWFSELASHVRPS
jgi:DNA-binding winged helix-turn-helix (wHTH) protein